MANALKAAWNETASWRTGFGRGVTYVYLMRFALLLWLSPLLLLLLKCRIPTFMAGIFNVEHHEQMLCNIFFLIATGFLALINARIVALNGKDRFDREPPEWIKKLLGAESSENSLLALLLAPVPALAAVALWVIFAVRSDHDLLRHVGQGVVEGMLVSALFWGMVNAFYLWTYDPTAYPPVNGAAAPVKALLMPSFQSLGFDSLERVSDGPHGRAVRSAIHAIFDWFAVRLGPGYVSTEPLPEDKRNWPLWEGHILAVIAAGSMLLLYLLLFPLTAPIRDVIDSYRFLGGAAALAIISSLSLWLGTDAARKSEGRAETATRLALTILPPAFVASVWIIFLTGDPERFPTLSFVLLLLMWVLSLASALAFFLDRYHVPVVILVLCVSLIFNLGLRPLLLRRGGNDHYFVARKVQCPCKGANVPTPSEILQYKMRHDPDGPLIIVTATGGGIHAAAWTAELLGQLELKFDDDHKQHPHWFRDHLLLVSTVSGGSVGLLSYLQELSLNDPLLNWDQSIRHMRASAYCSSLEAAGWGLAYPDFLHGLTGLTPISTGDEDQGPGLFRDRTWALAKAFNRNLANTYCATLASQLDSSAVDVPRYPELSLLSTLPHLEEASDGQTTDGGAAPTPDTSQYPAFSMNTTVIETGGRFLLANYRIPQPPNDGITTAERFLPAESFLDVFGPHESLERGQRAFADLPLYSAAQLSATFPYVSSVTRIPLEFTYHARHFGDGGYYDNDGVGSALEFLCYALKNTPCSPKSDTKQSAGTQPTQNLPRILFIEIRDSEDISTTNPDSFSGQQPENAEELLSPPAYPFNQLTAPLEGFWQASHQSITLRNRRETVVAKPAIGIPADQWDPVVLAFSNAGCNERLDPQTALSWSLLPSQRRQIYSLATKNDCQAQKRIAAAVEWARGPKNDTASAQPAGGSR